MAFQTSDAVANARLDAFETTVGTSAKLEIFSGTKPANCAAADAGTKLCSMSLPSDWMANASARSKAKTGTWSGTGIANGYATYFRIKDSAGSVCHAQGDIGEPWQASRAYVLGMQVVNGGNVYKCTTAGTSAASGGPTGTTTATDNTVTWTYVSTADMTMDNTSVTVSQAIADNTFTLTDGNA